uniref:Uncharacterized conserved protein, DUF433 family n=1 Tax=Candidatus Kentrum sp. FM TaxID=2126340 RepID=A0A450TSN4_9GAMM|nr:MAG: Uncharacterized conserved protein, DUF433 family [Candidatus Kentron sp. FM]VFJ71510.1 MAG: Uncharacterized conserved protein, DUF433 family [Candidatus Kentron sp. FM]VFK18928.1 MAG: Uncharacterized conserved protein, DUF433 family [Candidatus Kentron sp. FM]
MYGMSEERKQHSGFVMATDIPMEKLFGTEYNKYRNVAEHRRKRIETMNDWTDCPAVERDPGRVSGAWVFRGTRVPVSAFFENIEDGAGLSEFVDWFPGITIEQARMVLAHAAHTLDAT